MLSPWGPALISSKGTWPILLVATRITCSQLLPAMPKGGPDLCAILLVPFWDEGGTHYNLGLKAELSQLFPTSSGALCDIEGLGEVI